MEISYWLVLLAFAFPIALVAHLLSKQFAAAVFFSSAASAVVYHVHLFLMGEELGKFVFVSLMMRYMVCCVVSALLGLPFWLVRRKADGANRDAANPQETKEQRSSRRKRFVIAGIAVGVIAILYLTVLVFLSPD
jgi:hypothetical protein